jgi:hypothetical protein
MSELTPEQVQADYESIPNPPIVVESSPYIITLEELQSSLESLLSKENSDRLSIIRFVEPGAEELKRKLLQWASLGFPAIFVLFSIPLEVPEKCSDGQVRDLFNYVNYLLGTTLGEKIQLLNSKLPGMQLSYSIQNTIINMHVSKS